MRDMYVGPRHKCEHKLLGVGMSLYKHEILYDVEYALWRISESAGVTGEKRSLFEISKEEYPWFDRVLVNAQERLCDKIRWAVCNNMSGGDTMVWPSGDEIDVMLRLDRKEWRGDAGSMATAAHEYMVNYVLKEWAALNMPDKLAYYQSRADEELRRVHDQVDNYVIEPPKHWM